MHHSLLFVIVQYSSYAFFLISLSEDDLSFTFHKQNVGRDNSVGIATAYGLDGPGIQSRWGRDFLHLPIPGLEPTVEPLIDIAADRNLKDIFKWAAFFEFWSLCRSEFPEIAKHIVQPYCLPACLLFHHTAVRQHFHNWCSPRPGKETKYFSIILVCTFFLKFHGDLNILFSGLSFKMHRKVIHFEVCDVVCYIFLFRDNKRVCLILYLTYCGHV